MQSKKTTGREKGKKQNGKKEEARMEVLMSTIRERDCKWMVKSTE